MSPVARPTPTAASSRAAHRVRGFTLLELLIIVTVFGIVSAIGGPMMLRDDASRDAHVAGNQLANTLREARFRASALNRNVYVDIQPDGTPDFYTAYADLDGDPSTVPTGTDDEVDETAILFPDTGGGYQGRALSDVAFSVGNATSSPEPGGGTPGGAIDVPDNPFVFTPTGMVRWPSGSSDFRGTIYLTSMEDADAVAAVTVTRTGVITVSRLINGSWQ